MAIYRMEEIDAVMQRNHSVILLTLISQEAREWIEVNTHTEPWQWWAENQLALDHRMTSDVIGAMRFDGLIIAGEE